MLRLPQLARDMVAAEAARLRAGLIDAAVALVLLAVAALIALVGLIFLLVGAYQSLAGVLPAWQAGGIVALAVAVVAGALALWASSRLSRRRPRRPAEPPPTAVSEEIRRATERGVDAGEMLSRSGLSAFDLTLAAFVAGLVVSRTSRPRNRRRDG